LSRSSRLTLRTLTSNLLRHTPLHLSSPARDVDRLTRAAG
jgi:hypothetical protein